jgi:uncharacterized protein with HEPN domain
MSRKDENLIRLMIEAAQDALSFVADKSRADLDEDKQLVLALVKSIETLGLVANKVSDEFKREHSGIA